MPYLVLRDPFLKLSIRVRVQREYGNIALVKFPDEGVTILLAKRFNWGGKIFYIDWELGRGGFLGLWG